VSEFNKARSITLERLSQIFGHETAHLERCEQFAIALEARMMFARTSDEIAQEMKQPTVETTANEVKREAP
jgi:hypothetical protein